MSDALHLEPVSAGDWPRISAGFADLEVVQTGPYCEAAARRIGARTEYVALRDGTGALRAAACLRIKVLPGLGAGIAWIASGPLTRPLWGRPPEGTELGAVLEALRDHATAAGHILRLRLPVVAGYDPEVADRLAGERGFVPTSRAPAYRTVLVDLRQDEEALMAGLHGKWRNALRGALKAGLSIDCIPFGSETARFEALYAEVKVAKGFSVDIPPEFYWALDGREFRHDLLIATKEGDDLAALSLGQAGSTMVYLFGGTSAAGRTMNAGHFVMWQAILHGRALGLTHLDLGGIDLETNPSVAQFKLRTGGSDLKAPGPYEYRPEGLRPSLVGLAETLHRRLRGRRA